MDIYSMNLTRLFRSLRLDRLHIFSVSSVLALELLGLNLSLATLNPMHDSFHPFPLEGLKT